MPEHTDRQPYLKRAALCSGFPSDEMKKLENMEKLFYQAVESQMEVTDQIPLFIDDVISHLQRAVDKLEGVADANSHLPIIDELKAAILEKYDSATTPLYSFEFWDNVREINQDTQPVLLDSYKHRILDGDKQKINELLVTHLYREYHFDIGDSLLAESGEPIDRMSALRSMFMKLPEITNAVMGQSIEIPLKWISDNRETLGLAGSELEFKLHVLKFIELLKTNPEPNEGIVLQYAKDHFSRYSGIHMSEIQKLMGCMVLQWDGVRSVHPRYAYLFDKSYKLNIIAEIERRFYILMGQCVTSPLSTVTCAGAKVLSGVCKAANIVSEDLRLDWTRCMDIPLYAQREDEFKILPEFVCPLTGEVMKCCLTIPVALSCGHVFMRRTISYYTCEEYAWGMDCPICSTWTDVGPDGYKKVNF